MNRRAAFIHLATFSYGPATPMPLFPYAIDVPCRMVPQQQIFFQTTPLNSAVFWLTIDQFIPNGPNVLRLGNDVTMNLGWSDLVTLNHLPGQTFRVLAVETSDTPGGPVYYRARLETAGGPA